MKRPLLFLLLALVAAAEVTPPQVLDPNLKIELIAAEPDINTPIGIAVDKKDRLFVVENNTHQVRPDYKGPKSDRIRIFQKDSAGKWNATTFAEGFRNAMCLEFDPDGVLHFTMRDKLLKLEDTNNDGVCDKQTELMRWETKGDYPHNGLSGMIFAPDGWLYVGSGENLQEKYIAIGADGKRIEYQPGGANIFRIHCDGTGMEIVATGLWNGFGLECDGAGRILAVDNDPDACPPNRLLHIVPGGDYGFNMTYGRAGTHPFQCWNGEIPGTLPMICGVGEGAVDVLDMRRTAFRKPGLNVLVTSWGDNQIEAYKLVSNGASVTMAERTVLVHGDAGFRPSGMAVGTDGSVYVNDWADREYSVHGKGRIWKLSAVKPSDLVPEEARLALSEGETAASTGDRAGLSKLPHDWSDAFAMQAILNMFASREAAKPGELKEELQRIVAKERPADSTLGMLMMFKRLKFDYPAGALNKLMQHDDARISRIAIIHAAERRLKELKPDIEAAIKKHGTDREVFRTGIAALELIDKDASAKPSGSLDGLLMKIITDAAQPAGIRGLAMLYLNNRDGAARTLLDLAKDKDVAVAAAAARTLGSVMKPDVTASLRGLALDAHAPLTVRLEALGSLAGRADTDLLPLLPLLKAAEPGLARQAVRTLRGAIGNPEVRAAFEQSFESLPSLASFLALALGKPPTEIRPATDEQWHEAIRTGKGDADEGRRVFFSAGSLCATCHIAEGRGVRVGPDLSTVARATNREKLIDSILTPSREIGPLYVMRTIQLKDGTTVGGIQSDKESGGRVDIYLPGGQMQQIPHTNVAKIDISPVSLMPEALELNLTVQEFRDLIAYLETLK